MFNLFFQKNLSKIKILLKDLFIISFSVGLVMIYLNQANPENLLYHFIANIALAKSLIFLILYFFLEHLVAKFFPKTKYTPVPKNYLENFENFLKNNETSLKKISSFLLLFFLALFFLEFINFNFKIRTKIIQKIIVTIQDFKIYLIFATAIIGALFFKINSAELKKIDQENQKEKTSEKKRFSEFQTKFPKLNKFPLLNKLFRWIYKENWKYLSGLILILIIFTSLGAYKLGDFEIRGDEFQVVASATTYYKTGEYYKWDWLKNKSGKYTECMEIDRSCNYTRAWPHTFLIAQSYKIFGISEWSSRIVSLLAGIVFLIIVYFTTKYFFISKNIALLATLTLALNPEFLTFFRYIRMYALLAPLFLLLIYFSYRIITESNSISFKNKKINQFITENFDFNLKLLPIVLILLFFNYHIHVNSLVVLPSLALFIFYSAWKFKNKKYYWGSLICLAGILISTLGIYLGYLDKFTHFLTFFERFNYRYLFYLTVHPFGEFIGIIILLIIFFAINLFKKENKNKLIFFYLNILFPLFFFIFIAARYSNVAYCSHITVLAIILIITNYYYLIRIYKNKIIKFILFFILFLFLGINLFQNLSRLYGEENDSVDFKVAYKEIVKNFNPSKQVIFGQFLRSYYLKEIADENVRIIDMLNDQKYSFETFLEDLKKYDSGYVTFETRKNSHLQKQIKNYLCDNFEQLHGNKCEKDIDKTGVEVFYFDQEMIKK